MDVAPPRDESRTAGKDVEPPGNGSGVGVKPHLDDTHADGVGVEGRPGDSEEQPISPSLASSLNQLSTNSKVNDVYFLKFGNSFKL